MLVSNYKRFAFTGILLMFIFALCEAALVNDDTGFKLDLGIGFTILIIVFFLLLFLFFVLPIYYVRSLNQKLFAAILILGLLTIILPAINTWYTITSLLKPKETGLFANLDLFKTSAFRSTVTNIETVIIVLLFLCQVAILILSFKIKKLRRVEDE